MPFSIQNLIEGRQQVVVVSPDEPLQSAVDLMIGKGFSQVAVVDDLGAPLGLITSDSILSALNNFGVTIGALRVSHAMVHARRFRTDDDLFELLNDLRDQYAVLIVDADGKLVGIVTSYDATEYFRRRAEDMMLVEDIESMIKDKLLLAFTDENGEYNQAALEVAIAEITESTTSLLKRFSQALAHYLKLQGDPEPKLKPAWLQEAFALLYEKEKPKTFEQLTLREFTELILHKNQWVRLGPIFDLEPNAIRNLLDNVRNTRNTLAHFRGEISLKERDQLRFAANWLKRAQPPTPPTPPRDIHELSPERIAALQNQSSANGRGDAQGIRGTGDNRFARLAIFLQDQPMGWDTLQMTFEDIEAVIDDKLPASAREHRAWWSNDPSQAQAQQWLRVGWKVSNINMNEEKVIFTRNSEAQGTT